VLLLDNLVNNLLLLKVKIEKEIQLRNRTKIRGLWLSIWYQDKTGRVI